MHRNRFSFIALFMLVSLILAACGGGDAATTPGPGAPGAVTPPAETTEPAATEAGAATTPDTGAPDAVTPAATDAAEEGADATPEGEEAAEAPAPAEVGNTPPVPNAEAARQFDGATITYYGDAVGLGAQIDQALAQQFTKDTGIQVNVIPKPKDATENYATYLRFFQAQSPDIDVMMLDVIWPGVFARHLYDLTESLGEEAQNHTESIIQNNTVGGRLIAMPWFTDFGMLYYRTDLLEKYNFDAPPTTWDELEQMAQTIQDGERGEGNAQFQGFVWQGNAYEGLTCNALEWVYSNGGGTLRGRLGGNHLAGRRDGLPGRGRA
jgi:trehalose/maltose transport system substrate-binding protein